MNQLSVRSIDIDLEKILPEIPSYSSERKKGLKYNFVLIFI